MLGWIDGVEHGDAEKRAELIDQALTLVDDLVDEHRPAEPDDGDTSWVGEDHGSS